MACTTEWALVHTAYLYISLYLELYLILLYYLYYYMSAWGDNSYTRMNFPGFALQESMYLWGMNLKEKKL